MSHTCTFIPPSPTVFNYTHGWELARQRHEQRVVGGLIVIAKSDLRVMMGVRVTHYCSSLLHLHAVVMLIFRHHAEFPADTLLAKEKNVIGLYEQYGIGDL